MHLRKRRGRIRVTPALIATGLLLGLILAVAGHTHGSGPARARGSARPAASFPDGYRAARNSMLNGELRTLHGPGYRPIYLVGTQNARAIPD